MDTPLHIPYLNGRINPTLRTPRAIATIILTVITAIPALIGLTSHIIASQPFGEEVPTTLHQGDRVSVEGSGYCTIGYVDAKSRTAITAKHCAEKLLIPNAPLVKRNLHVISRTAPTLIDDRDIAIIHLSDNVRIGGNPYTGDTLLTASEVAHIIDTRDVQVCNYGKRSNTVTCQDVARLTGNTLFGRGATNIPGDSGGPVWLKDDTGASLGFIGVVSATGGDFNIYALNKDQ